MVSIGLEHVQVGRFGRSITATQMKGLTDGRMDGRTDGESHYDCKSVSSGI